MKLNLIYTSLIIAGLCGSILAQDTTPALDGNSQYEPYAPDGIPFVVASESWKADMQGNHRAVIQITPSENLSAVRVNLPWRRPDLRPDTKKILVVDATTGEAIKNVLLIELRSEQGSFVFKPTQSAQYFIYYLPYKFRTRYDDARYGQPWNDYLAPTYSPDKDWIASIANNINNLPIAKVIRFESRTEFDAFTPMGTIATQKEMDSISATHPENPILFTEDRAFPIRLVHQLPVRWISSGPSSHFAGSALRNEYYVWQIGVWAAHDKVDNLTVLFSDFTSADAKATISKEEVTCFNQGGINWDGTPISFTINVPENNVQALWCGIQIPENAQPGVYTGTATLRSDNMAPQIVNINIEVTDTVLANKGDNDLWRHARLRWLNSTLGTDNHPVAPYKAMTVQNLSITATDKQVTIATNGLPANIQINNQNILASPMQFLVETKTETILFHGKQFALRQNDDGLVTWHASETKNGITFDCIASMEFDGYLHYNINVSSSKEIEVKDIRLVTDYSPYASEYFMGVGTKGGTRPTAHDWKWNGPWDSYWIGGTKAGLHTEFRGGTYHGPLINDYKPAPTPVWFNNGKGHITETGDSGSSAQVVASTGACILGTTAKDFEFALLITPVKPVDPAKHFSERYFHANPMKFDDAAKEGANICNIHHAQPLNPVINYPFIVREPLKQFIADQHQKNRKVKLYYTIRELTTHAQEVYALKSLNHEIFVSGVGYGLPWECEHLIDDYKPAWYTPLPNETSDAALVLNGFSRWINYYLEGLNWMLKNYQIDGLYMDDVAFDRTVMKRMRKIMSQSREGCLIDLHSNTGYSVGPANQYTDFFPYVDRLWFGETFRYNQLAPDEWFVTFSGIPFGQMSEMLQDGGNRFLGMVYGATARHSSGIFSPTPVWKLWQSFGITEAKMLGYWDEDCPVKTDSPNVKSTAYVKPDQMLISVGNFDSADQTIHLTIDWNALGFDPNKMEIFAPAVKNFQDEKSFSIGEGIKVKAKEGWLLLVREKK